MGGFSRDRSILFAFLAAALLTPLRAVLAYPFARRVDQAALGALSALSADVLVYIDATHLLPEVEEQGWWYTVLALAAGVMVGILIVAAKG